MSSPTLLTHLETEYAAFPAQFWTLVAVTFIDRLGSYMLYPFFALYITDRFGVGMSTAGLLFAAFSVGGFLGSGIGGGLIDYFGRRRVIIFSLIATSSASVIIGLVSSYQAFFILAALVGTLTVVGGPAYDAVTADLLPPEKRARGFGVLRIAYNLAAALGPAIGGFIASRSYLGLFLTDAAISLAAAGVVYFTLRETKPALLPEAQKTGLSETYQGYWNVLKDRMFMLFVFVGIICGLTYVNMSTTLGVFLRDVHGVPEQGYGLLRAANAVMIILLQLWVTRRIEKRPVLRMMAVGALCYGLGFGLFGFTSTYILFVLSVVIVSFGDMVAIPLEQALVAKFAPADMRGRYIAVQTIGLSLPLAVGPYLGGLILDGSNPNLLWYFAGAAGAAAALGYLLLGAALDRVGAQGLPKKTQNGQA